MEDCSFSSFDSKILMVFVSMSDLVWVFLAWAVLCGLPQDIRGAQVPGPDFDDEGPGKPLFLTPFIEQGNIAEARKLARVTLNDSLNMESYAGFFTVNKTYDSNQFLWYFPCMSSDKDKAPVLVWLQGGPGASSLFGLFVENGPIQAVNGHFERRKFHWALNHHVIYIDNPVGAGFSFTKDPNGYCTNETQVGEQLYTTLTQFFQLFPELQQNAFYITGESYAGKYVPALAHTIIEKKSVTKTKINLKGLIIGGAWINPDSQKHFMQYNVCNKYNVSNQALMNEATQMWTLKSLKKEKWPQWQDDEYVAVLTQNTVRKAIHAGNLSYEQKENIYEKMRVDFCQSMAPWLSKILDRYPVTLYGGQYDDTVSYNGIVDFLRNHFNFSGADEYKTAKQYEWRVDGEPAGCVRRARLLTDVYVLDATHFVPADQPKRAWDMITRLTHGKGFEEKEICTAPS